MILIQGGVLPIKWGVSVEGRGNCVQGKEAFRRPGVKATTPDGQGMVSLRCK